MIVRGHLIAVTALVAVAACGSREATQAPASSGKVSFVEPKDGATVKSPVYLKFAVEGYQISPVPQGTVETARPGMGHYHVGVDQDCLAPGATIVKGTPAWVHMGTGSSEIDMQLTPGKHKLALQIGDDLHKTVEGFCQTITVTVEP